MSTLVDLSPLAVGHTGGELLKGEVLDVITTAIANQPRTLQARIGPSGVGTPCTRQLGYQFTGTPKTNVDPTKSWKPTIGSAVHTWLEEQFIQANHGQSASRWLLETTVDVGEVNGEPITGHADLYDIHTGTVVDFKVLGPTGLKKKKAAGDPGDLYRIQLHLYGRGFIRRGLPVTSVALLALPRNDELRGAWWWSEPYDEQIAVDALARAATVAGLSTDLGTAVLDMLPTAEAHCSWCDWFNPAAKQLVDGCKGHPSEARLKALTPPTTVAEALG